MIEFLESRIAPASLILGGKGVTFTDTDGDAVTVKTTKGVFDIGNNITFVGGAGHERVFFITCDGSFLGADLTVSVVKKPGGDGKTNVTAIDAASRALGNVKIAGDLEAITCGGLKSLTLGSFGVNQSLAGVQASLIAGTVGNISIKGNFDGESLRTTGGAFSVGAVTIGGSVVGSGVDGSGCLTLEGSVKSFTVGGNVIAGAGANTGCISLLGVGQSSIKGSVKIAGDIDGGQVKLQERSGAIVVGGGILNGGLLMARGSATTSVTVKGDIGSGGKLQVATASVLSVGGSVDATMGDAVFGDVFGTVKIGRSVTGTQHYGILVSSSVTNIQIGGDVSSQIKIADIEVLPGAKTLAALTIKGSVTGSSFTFETGKNNGVAFTHVGPITVGGDWTNSSIFAGVDQIGPFMYKNQAHPLMLDGVVIKGFATLTGNGASVIAADQVKHLKIHGKTVPLNPAADENRVIFDETGNEAIYLFETN